MLRILLTGGGTGGHIYPLIAVAEELRAVAKEKNLGLELRYFGVPGSYRDLLEKEGILISKILGAKIRRYFDLRNFLDIPKFFLSFFQLLWKILIFMPDVLFSKGGPGALAAVLVCRFYRIPVFIHESDSVPGITNQISGKYAKKIFISFPSAADYFSKETILTGNPVRLSILKDIPDQKTSKTSLGFNPELPLVLFMGGSQGATRINDFVLVNIRDFIKEFQVFLQTGADNFEDVQKEMNLTSKDFTSEEKARYKITPYFEDIKSVYSAADIIVSRAGSGSIFEIAAFGKPAILVPLPEAAGNHQVKNAYEYAKTGAALVIETDNLTPNVFLNEIKKLFANPEKLKVMSETARAFAKPEAARVIAEEVIGSNIV